MDNWKDVWSDAVAAASGKLKSRAPEAEAYVREIADAQRSSLEALLSAFVEGKIDRPTLDGELADEKRVLRAELLALRAITKKTAQDAANAFFSVIEKALFSGIGGLL